MSRRHIIVSNRLPLTWNSELKIYERSTGGVVSAILGIAQENLYWLGHLPGKSTTPRQLNAKQTNSICFKNVAMPQQIYHDYYNGYCNRVLWPLFHYEVERCHYRDDYWQAYQQANQYFCDALLKLVRPGDTIWIHDYQLCLLPALLRQKLSDCPIGFFLHIPFPSSEIFQQLPQRKQLLQSILASDLIGFQDYHYLRHFCSSASRLLEIDNDGLHIHYNQRFIELGVFPVSVDSKKIIQHSQRRTRSPYQDDCFTFLGVDRLDYIKGLDMKLDAFDRLLATHPQFIGKVKLYQIATPTRTNIPEYQQLKQKINEQVGRINGKYATIDWTPVHYLNRNLDHDTLIPLYRHAQALLITSKRDGFNLVALEYLLSQPEKNPGVLLLSEFTGAFSQLRDCLALNPWDSDTMIAAMLAAIHMPLAERKKRWQSMIDYIKQYNAAQWAQNFLNHLSARKNYFINSAKPIDPTLAQTKVLFKQHGWHKKRPLVLFLDYDGTLVPIVNDPAKALLPLATQQLLQQLITMGIEINILSGRKKPFLSKQFNQINVTLVAEHGAFIYNTKRKRWQDQIKQQHSWLDPAAQIMTDYVSRVPNSSIEQKKHAIVWHYRKSSPDYSTFHAFKLYEELKLRLHDQPVTVAHGKKTIEVKHIEASKAHFIQQRMAQEESGPSNFYIAIGDDITDEDMFDAIGRDGISIKVGADRSLANICLTTPNEAIRLLRNLIKL